MYYEAIDTARGKKGVSRSNVLIASCCSINLVCFQPLKVFWPQ